MGWWSDFKRLFRTLRSNGSPGDVGLLKAELFGAKPPTGVDQQLATAGLDGYLPELRLADLRRLDDGTLGREYARMLDANGYQPFHISADLRERALRQTYLMRYIATHDFIHVVTGFDTSYAGELGVLVATVEQGFAPGGGVQEWVARWFYPLRSWKTRRAIKAARAQGHLLGKKAKNLLVYRYEDAVARPLTEVRAELGLAA